MLDNIEREELIKFCNAIQSSEVICPKCSEELKKEIKDSVGITPAKFMKHLDNEVNLTLHVNCTFNILLLLREFVDRHGIPTFIFK